MVTPEFVHEYYLEEVMKIVESLLREINPYYHAYKNMRDIKIEQENMAKRWGISVPVI